MLGLFTLLTFELSRFCRITLALYPNVKIPPLPGPDSYGIKSRGQKIVSLSHQVFSAAPYKPWTKLISTVGPCF